MRMQQVVGCLSVCGVLALSAGCTGDSSMFASRASRVSKRVKNVGTPVRHALDSLDADAQRYTQHPITLSNPFFEGRAPGTRGIQIAAEYLEFVLADIGLEPVFASGDETPGGMAMSARDSYRQTLARTGFARCRRAALHPAPYHAEQPIL